MYNCTYNYPYNKEVEEVKKFQVHQCRSLQSWGGKGKEYMKSNAETTHNRNIRYTCERKKKYKVVMRETT